MSAGGRKLALLAGAAALLAPAPALADTLKDALLGAYQTNPTLQAARANQRATDENVPINRASGLPSVSGTATYTEQLKETTPDPNDLFADRSLAGSLTLSVPVYSGGSVRNSVSAAETRVKAGQASLRATESSVFSQTVTAYMDVILNEAIVNLSANNVDVLSVNLQATQDRFEIGDLTRTDVAQSESRLALAQGNLRTARANLSSAKERYIQIVGNPPENLEAPPPLPGLPATPQEAVSIALENNPDLIAARDASHAARYDIEVAGAGRLPKLEVFTSGTYSDPLGTIANGTNATGASAGVRATIPLFQGGRPAAQERQAQARSAAALEQEIGAERSVISQVRAAFSSLEAANSIIASTQTAVSAAELSLEGVRAENTVGNRTILEILNAEQELLSARVQLVTARRNAYVAGFTLLAAMGRAEARDLGLGDEGVLYDPQVNYDRVKGKIWDWSFDPDPVAQSTRTVDTPTQDGEIPKQ
ncbi:TolC family outer membrane protein [Altererythrobacter sp. CC-YST694]|uniref:TolC family outer membrane protein n=1 Tax=Altererythrobacter sp. CC-YST694 TaxID=2755038 RepID=UPI001D01C4AC|nr:TolC family outer membrane protein [Altererythrobacter sp. CC-YST694]MCB5425394.1 TolC family outer membrane protein [Altererythrobacter sp. CC-YST694]